MQQLGIAEKGPCPPTTFPFLLGKEESWTHVSYLSVWAY